MDARSALSLFVLTTLLAAPAATREERPAAARPTAEPASAAGLLRDGVVLDAERGALYAMRPGGGVLAVRLTDGALLWESAAGARPLALGGGILVVQGEGAEEATVLELVLLDLANRGRETGRVEVPLTRPARTLVADGLGTSFQAAATAASGEALVLWRAQRREVRGALLEPTEAAAPETDETLGAAVVDLGRGTVRPVEAPFPEPRFVREVPEGLRLPGSGPQYLSADGRHVLTSERLARDPEWNQYRWALHELATGIAVGALDLPVAVAPFLVAGSTLVVESRPFQRRETDGTLVTALLALRGLDLATGRELWSHDLRDTTYYGPFPP